MQSVSQASNLGDFGAVGAQRVGTVILFPIARNALRIITRIAISWQSRIWEPGSVLMLTARCKRHKTLCVQVSLSGISIVSWGALTKYWQLSRLMLFLRKMGSL